jgi:gliding motility-associated transport system ATP-binding protein
MIEVQHLTKRYGPFTAVDDVSFRVEKGEILGFLGPNGAGKTSTMRVITGYMPPTDGKVVVAGHDVFTDAIAAKRRTGYLPETPPLYPEMTVREYLNFVARIKVGTLSKTERAARVDQVMKKTHVDDMANRQCGKLSKGYKQRVGLAQALIHEPEVLVLDEPTAGLDPKQISETRELIRSLAGSHTIILSTHILPEVAQTCTRVVIINKGKVVAVDSPENLTHQLKGSATLYVQVGGNQDAAGLLSAIPGVSRVTPADRHDTFMGYEIEAESNRDIRMDVARAVVNGGFGLLELRPMRITLEEIFLQLTTEDAPDLAADQASSRPAEVQRG